VPTENDSLPASWARARIRDLEDSYVIRSSGQSELEREIVDVSLRYHVLSRFTAFVAVDPRVVNENGAQHHVIQPVETPHGWPAGAMAGGFGAAPAGFAPPPAPAMASGAPRLFRSRAMHKAPPQPFAAYVTAALERLRELETHPEAERRDHLAALADEIEQRIHDFRAEGVAEPMLERLRSLVTALRKPDELDARWRRTVAVFRALAQRESFWKR
jgi:Ca-activated chloride channel family protein